MYILILWLLSNSIQKNIVVPYASSEGAISSTISFASKESCEKALNDVQVKSKGKVDGICVSTR